MDHNLFEAERVYLDAFDPEKDAEVVGRWTNDRWFVWPEEGAPARPTSAALVKKRQEKEREEERAKKLFFFMVRLKEGNRPLGFVRVQWIEWTNGTGHLRLYIGEAAERGKGYGTEVLRLILRYAFEELNLNRLTASVAGYNEGAIRFFERAGFVTEVVRRKSLQRDGRRWDLLMMGILREEWSVERDA